MTETTTDTRSAKLISIPEKVRRLIAIAEHPETPAAEAEVALRQANTLMTRHAIDEAVLRSSQTATERRRPVVEKWSWMESVSVFSTHLRTMLSAIARANRCKVVISYRAPYEATVIGMAEDAAWVQTLYTNCYLTFLSRLNPKFDPAAMDASIYAFKIAGHTWIETWWAMVDALGLREAVPTERWTYPVRVRDDAASLAAMKEAGIPLRPPVRGQTSAFVAAYRRHAAKIGDHTRVETHMTAVYRRSFAQAFADRIAQRLWQMERDSKAEVRAAGAELVLVGLEEAVNEALWTEFPNLHPDEVARQDLVRSKEAEETVRLEAEREDMKIAAMTPAKRVEYLEKKERAKRREQESNERYWAKQDARITHIPAGGRAGRAAADTVSLSRATKVDDRGATPGITS